MQTLRLVRFAALLTVLATFVAAPSARAGKVYLKVGEALALAFPKCEVQRSTEFLSKEQLAQASKLCGGKVVTALVYPYIARDAKGNVVGTAYFDTHRVRTLEETVMVVVDPQGRVKRIEVLAFAEPEDYVPRTAWYAQFLGKPLGPKLQLKRDIAGVTGATLTARATTGCVRRVLALHEVIHRTAKTRPAVASASTAKR